ncbi:MAG: protein kinase domain-containing protein, partial [Rhabdochlamydiaceae bacterium]
MLKEAVRDFSIVEEVRHAFLGKVLLVEHSLLKNRFFLIELDHQFIEPVDHFEKMARILPYIAKIDHPHILKIHDTFFYEGKWYLAYDASFFAENGWMIPSLYFSSCKDFEFEDDLAQFSYQLASALDYAKSLPFDKPFYHGGLNLNNILVKKDGSDLKTYLLDFGIASVFSSDFYLAHLQKRQESSSYDSFNLYQAIDCLAPEQKTSAYQPGDKIDAYAFGAVLYYLLKGHFPYGLDVDLSFESQKLDWA